MASYKKTGNTFKGALASGQYYLPTCSQATYVKLFNYAKPITHDPCEGAGTVAPPPVVTSHNIITLGTDNNMITIAGANIVHL